MVTNVVKCRIKEGTTEKYLEIAKAFVAQTRLENGCISSDIGVRLGDGNIVAYIEKWESEEALKAHNTGPVFQKYIPLMGEYFESSEVDQYIVSDTETI